MKMITARRSAWTLALACLLASFPAPAQGNGDEIVVGRTIRLFSRELNETRILQIALPAGYGKGDSAYPVVVVLDGDMNFGFTAAIARYLTAYSLVPEAIVVGIAGGDRNRDFLPELPAAAGGGETHQRRSGQAGRFLEFLRSEALPLVQREYRTLPYRAIVGHSLAGLFAVYALLQAPDLFSGYVSISPSLWWNDRACLQEVPAFYRGRASLKRSLFVSLADEAADDPGFGEQMKEAFTRGTPAGFAAEVRLYPDKNHYTTAVEATMDGLLSIFSSWMPSRELIAEGTPESIAGFFEQLSLRLGFPRRPPESLVNEAGYMKLRRNQAGQAVEMFRYNVSLYPGSANAYDSLAEACLATGDRAGAIRNYEKSLQLNPQNANAAEQLKKLKE